MFTFKNSKTSFEQNFKINVTTLPTFLKAKIWKRFTQLSQINLNKKVYRREKQLRNIAKEKFKKPKSHTNRNRNIRQIYR